MVSSGVLFERLHPSKRYKRYKSVTSGSRMGSGFRPCCYAQRNKHNEMPGKGGTEAFQTNVCYAFCNAPGSRMGSGFEALSVTSFRLICNTSNTKYYCV
jgi:hypothetical protein